MSWTRVEQSSRIAIETDGTREESNLYIARLSCTPRAPFPTTHLSYASRARYACVIMKRDTSPTKSTVVLRDKITGSEDKKRVEDSILHPLEHTAVIKLLAFTEGSLVVDDRPGFFFRDDSRGQGDHTRACTPVLNDPEKLAIFPLLMEFAVCEIAGARI